MVQHQDPWDLPAPLLLELHYFWRARRFGICHLLAMKFQAITYLDHTIIVVVGIFPAGLGQKPHNHHTTQLLV